jgi:calcineurin-like phosphoesterase
LGGMNSGATRRERVFIQASGSPFRAIDWVAKLEASGVEVTLVDVHSGTTSKKQLWYGAGMISPPHPHSER